MPTPKKRPTLLPSITTEPFRFAVPGPECLTPRDGQWIERTKDYLFIAVLIERSRATGWIKSERQPDGRTLYTSAPEPAVVQGKGLPRYFSTKSLRHLLTRKLDLWIVRRYIQSAKAPSEAIEISNLTLCREGKWSHNDLRKQLVALRHPIEIGKPDALLANLHTQPFYQWCDLAQPAPCTLPAQPLAPAPEEPMERGANKLRFHQLLCPFDGPITPIEVCITSPTWTWKHLCGRAYNSLHCPHCLARLHSQLGIMN